MDLLQYIFIQIISDFVGGNVFYIYRKILGDKRNYKKIIHNTDD